MLFFFFFFWLQKFPGQGLDLCLCHSSNNAGSFTARPPGNSCTWCLRGRAPPAQRARPAACENVLNPNDRPDTEHVGPARCACSRAARVSSQDLIKVHHGFLRAIDVSMMAGGGTLAKVFLDFKER